MILKKEIIMKIIRKIRNKKCFKRVNLEDNEKINNNQNDQSIKEEEKEKK
jgi:hypothetical protein